MFLLEEGTEVKDIFMPKILNLTRALLNLLHAFVESITLQLIS